MTSLDDVYRKFGEVAEAAQLLETELGNHLLERRGREHGWYEQPNPVAARAALDQIDRSTLGQLLRQLPGLKENSDDATDLLVRALDERNRLFHSFYRQHNFRRNSTDGCQVMLDDLESIHEIIITAYKFVLRTVGIDLDAIVLDKLPSKHLDLD
ncbi:MAG TPA: hypothetical protein VN700_09280 [Vicinamibacterales bacterium]|nr:hypothetical protein [Vicinamibacterales bacterium]